MNKKKIVYKLLQEIPKGKVTTYKELARVTGIKNPRQIGRILHENKEPFIFPCYKVVLSSGRLATGYGLGGPKKQRELLEKDGIHFKDDKINLRDFFWSF